MTNAVSMVEFVDRARAAPEVDRPDRLHRRQDARARARLALGSRTLLINTAVVCTLTDALGHGYRVGVSSRTLAPGSAIALPAHAVSLKPGAEAGELILDRGEIAQLGPDHRRACKSTHVHGCVG